MSIGGISKGKLCRLLVAVSALSVANAWTASPAWAQEETRQFNVPAQPMGRAVLELGRQAGISISAPRELTRGRTSRAVAGSMTTREAISRMLEGSGLTFEFVNGSAVRIYANNVMSDPGGSSRSGEAEAGGAAADSEIVVTGTNIRGASNRTVPVISLGRRDIEESGYSSTEQLIQSLPQNYAGGQNGASEFGRFGGGSTGSFNIGNASGVNLRGLGTTSTLTLIEGQRVASAIQGTAIDISLIPLSAIERIEFLTDGASAVYGSDAVAGVVNIILRRDFEGAETRLRFGTVTDGPTQEYLASQSAGTGWDGGNLFGTVQYRRRDALPASAREFSETALQPNDLLPETEDLSGMFSLRQELGSNLEFSAFGLYADKSSDRSRRSTLSTSLQETGSTFYSVTPGLRWRPFDDWQFEVSGTLSRQHDEAVLFYSAGRPANYVNGSPAIDNRFRTWSLEARGSGPLFELPGGNVRVAFGGSLRNEKASYRTFAPINFQLDRNIRSLFSEAYVPLVGPDNSFPFVERLEVSAAIRYDDYSDRGRSTNPRVGVYWAPHRSVGVRAAYSTSFRVPAASEEFFGSINSFILLQNFQAPGGGTQPVFVLSGGGGPLEPETATNFTVGFVWTPAFIEGFTANIDYFDIDFRNRIIVPPFDTSVLLRPEVYGSLLTPLADDAAAQAYLNARLAEGYTYVGVPNGFNGVRYVYSSVQQNAARVRQRGIDFRLALPFSIGASRFRAQANMAYLDRLSTAFTESSTAAETVNTYGNPLRFRARGSLSWMLGGFNAVTTVNHSGSYRDTSAVPQRQAESWTTVDLNLTYTPLWLRQASFTLSALNLFANDPPRVQGFFPGVFFDAGNATPLGRFIAFETRVRW